MPAITINVSRFSKLVGRTVTVAELVETLPWLGLDIEDVSENEIKLEYNPNRPDYGCPIGIVRSYLGIKGLQEGLINYYVKESDYEIYVNASVKIVRPYIVGAVIKGVEIDEDTLKEIINLQEDLHNGLGRKRRVAAIGLHNLDVIKFPLVYTTVDAKYKFLPLDSSREMSIEEILSEHPIGRMYSHLVKSLNRFPVIMDSNGKVISFPPVINSAYTALTPYTTKNIFIDVTGHDLNVLSSILNILVTALCDYGGEAYSVKVVDGAEQRTYPLLIYEKLTIEYEKIVDLLGLSLTPNEVISSLRKCRLDAIYEEGKFVCTIPPYRIDIMHPCDLIEEVAIGYGYWRIEPEAPTIYGTGKTLERNRVKNKLIDIMVGAGFQEVINSTLTNPEDQYDKMLIDRPNYIEVKAPKSMLYRSLRTWIIPCLLNNLSKSKDAEYPHKIFELGPVVELTGNKIVERDHLAVAISHYDANYSEIKSILDSLMNLLPVEEYYVKEIKHNSFIDGRVGGIYVSGNLIGIIGELHPQVLANYQLLMPTTAFELDVDALIDLFERLKERERYK
ncbi:MAG: phenylalanine--tRNA ligase subunit beta [Candidatus Geothermarchaeota archaeon]